MGPKKKLKKLKDMLFYRFSEEAVRRIIDEEFHRPSKLRQLYEILYALHTRTYLDRPRLIELRNLKDYEKPFKKRTPLVSVRIATYNRAKILTERVLPSLLDQTYRNIEIVIVGDHCTDDTEERIKRVKDRRVRFYNLPYRGVYPQDSVNLRRVAGTLPMNEAAWRSKGLWIAPFDDDDVSTKDHIELLLRKAQEEKLELCYGKTAFMKTKRQKKFEIGIFPPAHGNFSLKSSIYHAGLRFFELDLTAWVVEEPGDWNLCRRMMAAGVRMGFIDKVVSQVYL